MKISNLFILVLAFVLIQFSCTKDDTTKSVITTTKSFGFEGLQDTYTIKEGESLDLGYTFNDDQIFELTVEYEASGSAVEDTDFELSAHSEEIITLQKSGSVSISATKDFETEGTEYVDVTFSSYRADNSINSRVVRVYIEDVVSTDLLMTFDWNGTFVYAGNTYPICGNVDLDIYVLDEDGNDTGDYQAATGACPEHIVLKSTAPDGTYILASNMWENGLAGLGLNVPFPIKVSVFKQDKFDTSFVPDKIWTSEDPDQANDDNTDLYPVAKIVKSGSIFTVSDPDGIEIAKGILANTSHKR